MRTGIGGWGLGLVGIGIGRDQFLVHQSPPLIPNPYTRRERASISHARSVHRRRRPGDRDPRAPRLSPRSGSLARQLGTFSYAHDVLAIDTTGVAPTASVPPITCRPADEVRRRDREEASECAGSALDAGFFRVRSHRMTPPFVRYASRSPGAHRPRSSVEPWPHRTLDPALHALHHRYGRSRAGAGRRLDRDRSAWKEAPLLGIPLLSKTTSPRAGSDDGGSKILKQCVRRHNVITNGAGKGAVIVGKTNCDKFAMDRPGKFRVRPDEKSVGARLHPGGSSGGSVAVAARLSVIGFGSIPAARFASRRRSAASSA